MLGRGRKYDVAFDGVVFSWYLHLVHSCPAHTSQNQPGYRADASSVCPITYPSGVQLGNIREEISILGKCSVAQANKTKLCVLAIV